MHLTVDLAPYTLQSLDLHVSDFATVNKNVALAQGKDFIAASGTPMVWITEGGYWAGKYPFRQRDFEKVAGYNPRLFPRRQPAGRVDLVGKRAGLHPKSSMTTRRRAASCLPASITRCRPNRNGTSSMPTRT